MKSCTLESILDELVNQGMVDQDKASMISRLVSKQDRLNLHPLELISRRQWHDNSNPDRLLDLEFLTNWLAEQADIPRFYFDPLKMDVSACTSVMSYAYASRFGILAVKVTDNEVTVAVTDPFSKSWISELEHVINKPITTVLANPQELKAYLVEFYSVSRAMEHAGNKSEAAPGTLHNLEQLIELGKTGSLDAEDQHIVSIVDWLAG